LPTWAGVWATWAAPSATWAGLFNRLDGVLPVRASAAGGRDDAARQRDSAKSLFDLGSARVLARARARGSDSPSS
jgi:hypothetical protein